MSNPPSDSMRSTSHVRPGRLLATIGVVVILMGIAAAVTYFVTVRKIVTASQQRTHDRLMTMTGLANPVRNKLDARFTDADGDLVADAPTDASQLVDPPALVFCYVAQENTDAVKAAWQSFMDALSTATGKPVEFLPVTNSDDQLRALRDGKLHVTGLNSGSVPVAINAAGYVPIARVPTNDPKGTHVEIIVPADSPLKSAADLKQQELTLTEFNSNSGFKAPLVLLRSDFGIEPERDYLIRTSGSHEQSILGVAKKEYQAAAVASDMIDRAASRGDIDRKNLRSIYQSESFPSAALGYAHNLKPELAEKIKEVILTFNIQGTPLATELSVEAEHFLPVSYKNDWALIRRIDDASGTEHVIKDETPSTQPSGEPATTSTEQ